MIKVFCDFDGTISQADVGNEFFTEFTNGKAEKYVDIWKAGKMDSREMYLKAVEDLELSKEQLNEFLSRQEIDPSFPGFVNLCESHSFPLYIISDGMDFYIKPLLDRNELSYLNVYSNKLYWKNGELKAEFPYYQWSCGKCANCKGYHLRRLRKAGDKLILVGDGLSDICAAKEADLVFAKNNLTAYCTKNNIAFFKYNDFSDIMDQFNNNLINKFGG